MAVAMIHPEGTDGAEKKSKVMLSATESVSAPRLSYAHSMLSFSQEMAKYLAARPLQRMIRLRSIRGGLDAFA